jgi:hypothetical protein
VFEELMGTLQTAVAATGDAGLRTQAAGLTVYRSPQGLGGDALYVIVVDPAVPQADYYPVQLLARALGPAARAHPDTAERLARYAAAVAGVHVVELGAVGAK